MRTRHALFVVLTLIAASQSGCAVRHATPQPEATTPPAADAPPAPISMLLSYSHALLEASPSARLAMLKAAEDAYAQHQSAVTAARLALAYGQPGYTRYAPENAWRYARKALAIGAGHWGSAATTYLRQFAALSADNDAVRDRLQRAGTRKQQLERQLTKARQKLRALTRIETKLNP